MEFSVRFYAQKNQNQRCFQAGGLAANKVDPPLPEPSLESPPFPPHGLSCLLATRPGQS